MRINPSPTSSCASSTASNELDGLSVLEPIWNHWMQNAPDIEEFNGRSIAVLHMIDCE